MAAQLAEGYLGIMAENDPFALVVPTTLTMLLHTPEDAILRSPYGSFERLTRSAALFISLLTPALYIAMAPCRSPTPTGLTRVL